jgi:uncharacterized protein with HEPN domain
MSYDDRYYLRHMLEYAHKIRALLGSRNRAVYDADETLRVTLTYWLQVSGEAARQTSEPFQSAHPEIPWRAMVGMHNRIVHDYLGIDDEIGRETVSLRIPELITLLESLVAPDDAEEHAGGK